MNNKFHIVNVLPLIAAIIIGLHSAAQSRIPRVPTEVSRAFYSQFPEGHLRKWVQTNNAYIAKFGQKGKKCIAYYTINGIWEATESPVKWTRNLPKAVRAGWNHCKYMDWLILDMKKIEKPAQTFYAIHVGQVLGPGPDDADIGREYILFFSEKGELIDKERYS